MTLDSGTMIQLLQIIWIDLLLSGDNAVVIALAVRNLPENQRRMGILLGTAAAIGLRIIFAIVVSYLMKVPFLKVVGALLLLWIAVKMLSEEDTHGDIKAGSSLFDAVKTIAIADAVMSLDNVLAVSAAAHGNIYMFAFGILLSIPIIIFGSSVVLKLLTNYPILVWAGAALLGWIAGEMMVSDPAILNWLQSVKPDWIKTVETGVSPTGTAVLGWIKYTAAAIGAAIVLALGRYMMRGDGDVSTPH
ncbi:MAG: TerC family protein [Beijerinckiaceae bacterium]